MQPRNIKLDILVGLAIALITWAAAVTWSGRPKLTPYDRNALHELLVKDEVFRKTLIDEFVSANQRSITQATSEWRAKVESDLGDWRDRFARLSSDSEAISEVQHTLHSDLSADVVSAIENLKRYTELRDAFMAFQSSDAVQQERMRSSGKYAELTKQLQDSLKSLDAIKERLGKGN